MASDIVLVTGASSGIGAAFARRLARDGRALGLVARRADRLEALAVELRTAHGVEVHVLTSDLGRPDAVDTLVAELGRRGLQVDWLVNNAGFGTFGRFDRLPLARELEEITVNVEALVGLTGRLVRPMVARGRGAVVNVSSVGGFFPSANMATYTATKAFVLSFSEAIAAELAGTGVHVLCVCPGFTRTGFADELSTDSSWVPDFMWMTADQVADEAVRAVGGTNVLVIGTLNRVMTSVMKFVPRAFLTRATANTLVPKES
jgi:short-subunit dehydrogenase